MPSSEFVMRIPYSAEKGDLYYPAKHAVLFPEVRPKSDAALCAELSRQAYCRLEPRYVDCCDMITCVPPKNFGYEHRGEPYHMNLARRVKFNPRRRASTTTGPRRKRNISRNTPGKPEMCACVRSPITRRATMSGPATAATLWHRPRQENGLQRDEEI